MIDLSNTEINVLMVALDHMEEEISDLRIQNVELVADMANIVTGFETTIANLAEQGIG